MKNKPPLFAKRIRFIIVILNNCYFRNKILKKEPMASVIPQTITAIFLFVFSQ